MIYFALLLLSLGLTYLIKHYAIKKSLLAHVNERSSHSTPTPHGGGIAIAITWFVGLFYLFATNQIEERLFYLLLLGSFISVISFIDDIYEISAKLRLLIQAVVAFVALYLLGGFNSIDFIYFTLEIPLVTNILAWFMIIWYINLFNFLDGINGYAGSEALFLALAGFIFFGGVHFIVLGVSVLGFLYWNFNKAKIFMGDVGSTLLGYSIAVFTLYYGNQSGINFWIWVALFSLFWFDATLTLLRRKKNGEKLSQAHKKHAYQRLTQAGWSHFGVTNLLIALNLILFALLFFIHSIAFALLLTLTLNIAFAKFVDTKRRFK